MAEKQKQKKHLVIVESPAKAKTIQRIIGSEYLVKASMGHVRDLPAKKFGVDITDSFNPSYVIIPARRKTIAELKKAAKDCDKIYLAPDPDREGEAIAWHLQELLASVKNRDDFSRVQYNEITEKAIRQAFANPGKIDFNKVNAQQARRILDRIVGYMVSPLLWRQVKDGLSAGRVQSVALRLVCEREKEIDNFVPEEYWVVGAKVRKLEPPLEPFVVKLVETDGKKVSIHTAQHVRVILSELENRSLRVASITVREVTRKPPAPLITVTLQQMCSTLYGFSPKRTMDLAQQLYEGMDLGDGHVGLITYMRTDSFAISEEAREACRSFIKEKYGEAYCATTTYVYKKRQSAQEAHEAIRPTDVRRTPESLAGKLEPALHKVYSVIWHTFVASQMSPAVIRQRLVKVETVPVQDKSTYLFHASDSEVVFDGYMKVAKSFIKPKDKDEGAQEEVSLPPLREGEPLECLEWQSERKETQPPPRYSEASLVRALESYGIGRPSTYAQIMATLSERGYVEKKKKTLYPTKLGMRVNEMLVSQLNELFSVKFTAWMEEQLDHIEKGEANWTDTLTDFYNQFIVWLSRARGTGVDQKNVQRLLDALMKVKNWGGDVKIGNRTFNDSKFVYSVAEQFNKGKEVSLRQFEALGKIASRYVEEVPELKQILRDIGLSTIVYSNHLPRQEKKQQQVVQDETVLKKLELLKTIRLPDGARDFVNSLASIVEKGRNLSSAQIHVMDSMLVANAHQIPDFEQVKADLDINVKGIAPAEESEMLINALKNVGNFLNQPGHSENKFNGEKFFKSVEEQYKQRGHLTVRQLFVLLKLVEQYRDRIPNYKEIVSKFRANKNFIGEW